MQLQMYVVVRKRKENILIEFECRPEQVFGIDQVQSCKNEDKERCQALLAHHTNPNSSLLFPFLGSHFDINENSSIFRPLPTSEVDIMGKKRFVGKTSSESIYISLAGLNGSLKSIAF